LIGHRRGKMAIWTSKQPGWFLKFPAEDRPLQLGRDEGVLRSQGAKGWRVMMPSTC